MRFISHQLLLILLLVPGVYAFVATSPILSGHTSTGIRKTVFTTLSTSTSHYEDGNLLQPFQEPPKSQSAATSATSTNTAKIGRIRALLAKLGLIAYIVSICVALPLFLLPLSIVSSFLPKPRAERLAFGTAQTLSRNLFRLIPFCNLKVTGHPEETPVPTIWVSNHVSPVDTFLLLVSDLKLRGKKKRPLKVIYWKGLDKNPVTRLLFHMAGFISVEMAANGNGNPNEYDKKSFKAMFKQAKKALNDGFDLFLLPEGQLNPWPEKGLLPIFSGAYALAHMSHRPIRFVGIHGTHRLWHADESIGIYVTGTSVKIKAYPPLRTFTSADDFENAFTTVIGNFGATGEDLPQAQLDELLYEA